METTIVLTTTLARRKLPGVVSPKYTVSPEGVTASAARPEGSVNVGENVGLEASTVFVIVLMTSFQMQLHEESVPNMVPADSDMAKPSEKEAAPVGV